MKTEASETFAKGGGDVGGKMAARIRAGSMQYSLKQVLNRDKKSYLGPVT